MNLLLDTNVLSEFLKSKPDNNVLKWINNTSEDMLHISVMSLGEIRKGIEKLQTNSNRKVNYTIWLERDLPERFKGRTIPIDSMVAEKWGYLASKNPNLPVVDGLIAATALVNNLTIVTRNVRDFNIPGLEIVNPWDDN